MPTATAVNTIMEGLPTPSLLNNMGKLYYAAIKYTHQLLMANAASIECDLSGGQNGYFGLILPPEKYDRVFGNCLRLPVQPRNNGTSPIMGAAHGREAHPL